MSDIITTPTPEPIYPYLGKNFAPKAPLDALTQQKPVYTPNSLTDALMKKYQVYMDRDTQAWQEQYDIGQAVANLRMGKLLVLRNPVNSGLAFVKRDSRFNDRKTVGGLFQFYSTKLTAEWLSSKPEIDPVCPSDDDQIEEFISAVKIVQDTYSKKFFTDNYEYLESLSAQDYGTWVTRFRYDPMLKDIVCELLDFPACRWDIRFRAEESPYFIYESKVSNAVLETLLNADIGSDDGSTDNYGLQVIEQIARQGGNVSGDGKERPYGGWENRDDENKVTEMWLQPEAYCDIEIGMDEETIGGADLKKGMLTDTFPAGICVTGINGMQTIIALHAEDSREHIVTGLYHIQSFSGVGKGISDAVDVKKDMDDIHSATLTYIKAHATPATAYAKDLISEKDARDIGKPRKIIPIDFKNAPEGMKSINEAIQPILPQNPANAAFEYGNKLNEWLQMSMQVTDFTNALPGVDNTTATGARIGDANAEMVLVPQHRNKANHRIRCAKVIFNLFKKYQNVPKWFSTKALNPITKGQYISGGQFNDVDVEFEIVANSEVPMTPWAQRDALSNLMQFTGGVAGIIEGVTMAPDIMGTIATNFGVKLPIPNRNDVARICRKRVEQAKQLLEQEIQLQEMMYAVTGEMPDNTDLPMRIVSQLSPPISPKEPHAQLKAEWLAELLDLDEMQFAPPELRYCIEAMIDAQIQTATLGQAQLAQDQNAAMVLANLPALVGEQYMNQQNQAIEAQFQAEQAQGQQQQQQAQMQQQLQLKAAEVEIERENAEADHQRSLAQEDRSHANAMEMERLKQKAPKAAPKKAA